jgi:chromosome segregation ATPase
MVAKGMKRSEEGVAPAQKKAKVDPKVASVKQTIDSADLPEPCKAMLLAMLPHSLCVPKDLRTEPQSRAVGMLGEVYDAIELKLKNAAEAEGAKVKEIEASKDTIDAALSEAESRHSATTATVESCKATLAQCFGTTNERKLAVAAAEQAEREGNAAVLIVEEEHQGLKCALDEHLKVLKDGSWEIGSAKRHLDALLPLATKLSDESLVTALPSTCIKPPADRSTFDNMVIQQLEATLTEKLTKLSADIETEKPAKAQRAAEVATAQQIFKEAEDAQHKASADTTSALSAQKDTLAVLELAKSDMAAFKPTLRKAKELADEAQAEVDLFQDNCRQHFSHLAAHTTKVEECASTISDVPVTVGGC